MKDSFNHSALGVPDLTQGNWLTMDVAGHGHFISAGPAETAPAIKASGPKAPAPG